MDVSVIYFLWVMTARRTVLCFVDVSDLFSMGRDCTLHCGVLCCSEQGGSRQRQWGRRKEEEEEGSQAALLNIHDETLASSPLHKCAEQATQPERFLPYIVRSVKQRASAFKCCAVCVCQT